MKKNTMLILTIILVACTAPVAEVPTAVPSATVTPQPTITPIPTKTPTPTLESWIVSLPSDVVSVEIKDETIFGLNAQGEQIMQFDVADGKWERVVKSCVDPDLIAELDAEFEARTGIDLDNFDANDEGRRFAEGLKSVEYFGYNLDSDMVGFGMIKTGISLVPFVGNAESGIDKLVCVYGRTGVRSLSNQTISVVVGWVDENGKFQNLADGVDTVNRKNLKPYEQLAFFSNLPDGAVMGLEIHTFSGITSLNQIQQPPSHFPTHEYVRDLVMALENQFLERLSDVAERDVHEYWVSMDPEKGDPGFILFGGWDYAKQIDLK